MVFVRLLVWLGLTAATVAQSATPSNQTYVVPALTNETVIMAVNVRGNTWSPYYLAALTSGALDRLPDQAQDETGDNGFMFLTGPSTPLNLSASDFAVIDCDPGQYSEGQISLSTVISAAISAKVTGIIFYSLTYPMCNITGDYGDYDALYSMTKIIDSQQLSNRLTQAANDHYTLLAAEILTRLVFNNVYNTQDAPAPGTAVAMIILYSITGLITALFLSIIVTGAIRAHRHPERYGRRDFLGRPTQSRARGLARAILDTIPIVKFGEQTPAKEEGVEMAGEHNSTTATHPNGDGAPLLASTGQNAHTSAGAQEHTSDNIDSASSSTSANLSRDVPTIASTLAAGDVTASPQETDSSLGCSICTDDFEKGQDIRVLPCSHKFHPACVDPWLLDVSSTCPLCRVDLRPTEASSSLAEGEDGDLAPPLRGEGGSGRRRARLGGFFANMRRVQMATPQERIAALRRLRIESRAAQSPTTTTTTTTTAAAPPTTPAEVDHNTGDDADAAADADTTVDQPTQQPSRLRRTLLGRGDRRRSSWMA